MDRGLLGQVDDAHAAAAEFAHDAKIAQRLVAAQEPLARVKC